MGGDQQREFCFPVRKLFAGRECFSDTGANIAVSFAEYHRNEKLRRIHREGGVPDLLTEVVVEYGQRDDVALHRDPGAVTVEERRADDGDPLDRHSGSLAENADAVALERAVRLYRMPECHVAYRDVGNRQPAVVAATRARRRPDSDRVCLHIGVACR